MPTRGLQSAASAQVDPALIKFVEALAIADARRDHLFDSERLMTNHFDAAGDKRISSGIRDETRSDLCSVLKGREKFLDLDRPGRISSDRRSTLGRVIWHGRL